MVEENESCVECYGTTYKLRELTTEDFLNAIDLAEGQKGYMTKILLQRAIVEPKIDIGDIGKIKAKVFFKLSNEMNKMNDMKPEDFTKAQKK